MPPESVRIGGREGVVSQNETFLVRDLGCCEHMFYLTV